MTREAIFINSSYRVYEWDDSENVVSVIAKDDLSITIKYEDGVINRVPIDYFRDELRADLVTYKPVFILKCRCKCGCRRTHNHSFSTLCENCIVGSCPCGDTNAS